MGQRANIQKACVSTWPHSAYCLMRLSLETLIHVQDGMERKPYRYSMGSINIQVAEECSEKKGCFIEPAPRSPQFLFILLYFGRYAYASSAVCQIDDCAWQNSMRNYFSSM